MSKIIIPKGYTAKLGLYDTQTAIGLLKRTFEERLCLALNLKRVSAPLFVDSCSGLNDDLSGVERAVSFDVKETGKNAVVVHSLAKWKRLALAVYEFSAGEGLYTDMNAIRRDEEMDNLHSIYTDQWDWEKIITKETRNVDYLKKVVQGICNALGFLHSQGIVHRDIKPENVMIGKHGQVVLIDLNVSRQVSAASHDTVVMGTVGYAPPEQLGIAQTDSRTDIYALGVLLNVMLTGVHPSQALAKGKAGRIVRRCTAVNPDDRFQSAEKLSEKL